MKHKLTVVERFALLGLLPPKGNFATQKVIRELLKRIEFSTGELKKMEYKQVEDRALWNPDKAPEMELDFGKYESEIISDALKELDEKKELERKHLSLYEKFVK